MLEPDVAKQLLSYGPVGLGALVSLGVVGYLFQQLMACLRRSIEDGKAAVLAANAMAASNAAVVTALQDLHELQEKRAANEVALTAAIERLSTEISRLYARVDERGDRIEQNQEKILDRLHPAPSPSARRH